MVVLEGPRGMIVLNAAAGGTGEPFIAMTDAERNSRISIGMEQAADGRQYPRIAIRDADERDLLRIEIEPSPAEGGEGLPCIKLKNADGKTLAKLVTVAGGVLELRAERSGRLAAVAIPSEVELRQMLTHIERVGGGTEGDPHMYRLAHVALRFGLDPALGEIDIDVNGQPVIAPAALRRIVEVAELQVVAGKRSSY